MGLRGLALKIHLNVADLASHETTGAGSVSEARQDDLGDADEGGHAAALAQVRDQITNLDTAILGLREEAERLLRSVAARTVPAVAPSQESPPLGETGFGAPTPETDIPDTDSVPVWPELKSPQSDNGSFGAPSEDEDEGETATLLEFAARAQTETVAQEEPALNGAVESVLSGMPTDWNDIGEDDEAIEKFFSSEVEPEPAQRWLLSD